MKPRKYQSELAIEGYNILKKYMICYLAFEERTGKTITAILMAEMCNNVKTIIVVTKKKALKDWIEVFKCFPHTKKYIVTNYHQIHKFGRPDLLILDEAHNYISGCPKQPILHKRIQNISMQIPIIYLSATPHPQGYQMLYHQFALSTWSPWRDYNTFYIWFKVYGIPSYAWFNGIQVPVYTKTKEYRIIPQIEHLFITKTRKELGFKYEPVDKLHYIELAESTKKVYNKLMKHKIYEFKNHTLVCDSPIKLRTSLHMLEGGVAKINKNYLILSNTEKIDYIKQNWGDTDKLVIYYHYIAEGRKLRKAFKNAIILQAVSFAEGIDLTHKDIMIIYSQDFSTAKYTQRRARQASRHRDKPIIVHFLLVKKAVSKQAYNTVAINKQNFVDSVFERIYL